ncbi:cytochrome P450 [Patulibacter medicamentivorans]|uniref:Cytochrome P450 n=1 Tax=Patulibacter medicamentivorans TaxID=1097667 RepID=H0E8E9_9ACTN|nr:cytochrome P450 [Patulibacter medicamentivorans]
MNLARFVHRPLDALLDWHARYGDVFSVRLTGFGVGVYVADPDEIKRLFTGDQSDLLAGQANAILSPILGPRSVLVLDGAEHLRQRKLLLPPFHGDHLAAMRGLIADAAAREFAGWTPGRRLVVRDRMRALTFDVIARVVFGVGDPARIERLRHALVRVIDGSSVALLGPLRTDLGPWSPGGRFRARMEAADALLHEEIALRRAAPDLDERGDVLSLLLRARDEEGRPMSDGEVRDELMTMLAAGHETTATALAFAVELLWRDPAALERVRERIAGDGGDAILDSVAKETLRLRPVIDAAQRTLTAPRTVGGHELPAGIRVYPGIALVQRRPNLYPEPDAFRPERFLDGRAPAYGWLPFGGGIRRCIGAALAQMELVEVLRIAIPALDLRLVRDAPDPVVLRGITVVPRHGVPVEVTRVRSAAHGRAPAVSAG